MRNAITLRRRCLTVARSRDAVSAMKTRHMTYAVFHPVRFAQQSCRGMPSAEPIPLSKIATTTSDWNAFLGGEEVAGTPHPVSRSNPKPGILDRQLGRAPRALQKVSNPE